MYANPNIRTSVDYIIMETKLDDFFIKSLNKKVDELLLDANRVSQSDKLVGQIVNGEQLNLSRNIKIFDKVYKFAEIMAEKYTSEYFAKFGHDNIFKAAECTDLWTVHQFAGDYNPIHSHVSGISGLSFIFWTKVPEKMRNPSANNLYSASGRSNGSTTFIGNSCGDFFNFHPHSATVYHPEIGYFLIFPNWLNHTVYPFMCDGERRTVAGNVSLYKSKKEYLLYKKKKTKHEINFFGNSNPLKWKICGDFKQS